MIKLSLFCFLIVEAWKLKVLLVALHRMNLERKLSLVKRMELSKFFTVMSQSMRRNVLKLKGMKWTCIALIHRIQYYLSFSFSIFSNIFTVNSSNSHEGSIWSISFLPSSHGSSFLRYSDIFLCKSFISLILLSGGYDGFLKLWRITSNGTSLECVAAENLHSSSFYYSYDFFYIFVPFYS